MEVILLKDVEKIGLKGEVKAVKDGFGRNFLLPRGLALVSTAENRKFVEEMKDRARKRYDKRKAEAQKKAAELKDVKLKIEAPSGEQGKLFGSVTADDIREALETAGHRLDKKQIHITEPIRTVGMHTVTVEIFPQIKETLSVEVIAKA